MTRYQLKGGYASVDPRLDRVPEEDERNRLYPIRTLLGVFDTIPPRPKRWRLTHRLDQGREGACVGFGFAHELAAMPMYVKQTNQSARVIYRRAQQLDQWPGENYEGTSVLAGAKAVQESGHMDSYRWAFSAHEVLATLSVLGPVVIGVNWYSGMYNTDENGFLKVVGDHVGGHCVCLRGVEKDRNGWYALGRNSWGVDWGILGDFKLRQSDLERLLSESGDACVPVLRS